jgi:hypothetical protein
MATGAEVGSLLQMELRLIDSETQQEAARYEKTQALRIATLEHSTIIPGHEPRPAHRSIPTTPCESRLGSVVVVGEIDEWLIMRLYRSGVIDAGKSRFFEKKDRGSTSPACAFAPLSISGISAWAISYDAEHVQAKAPRP